MAVIDSYGTGNRNDDIGVDAAGGGSGSTPWRVSQSFTGDGSTLGSIELYLSKNGFLDPTGNMYVKVYAHSGTFGTSSVPTGSALATSDAVAATVTTLSPTLVAFAFSGGNQITLTNATKYVLVLEFTSTSGGIVLVGIDTSSPSHGGNFGKDYDDL